MQIECKFHVLRPKKFSSEPKHMYTKTTTMEYANETVPLQHNAFFSFWLFSEHSSEKDRDGVGENLLSIEMGKRFFSSIFAFDATFNAIFS